MAPLGQESLAVHDPSLGPVVVMAARSVPALLPLPWLGAGSAPLGARLVLTVAISFTLALVIITPAAAAIPWAALGWSERVLLVARELGVGALLGGTVALVFWAADAALGIIQEAIGAAPPDGEHPTAVASLGRLLAVSVFLAVDGHLVLLRALVASHRWLPLEMAPDAPGAGWRWAERGSELVHISGHLVELAVVLAAPVIVATAITRALVALYWRLVADPSPPAAGAASSVVIGIAALILGLDTMATSLASAFGDASVTWWERLLG